MLCCPLWNVKWKYIFKNILVNKRLNTIRQPLRAQQWVFINLHSKLYKLNTTVSTFIARLLVQIIEKQRTRPCSWNVRLENNYRDRCSFWEFGITTFISESMAKNRKVSPFFCYSLKLDGNLVASCQKGSSHKNSNNYILRVKVSICILKLKNLRKCPCARANSLVNAILVFFDRSIANLVLSPA